MKSDGLVSICVPVYNGEAYLRQCLNSILNQTYKQIEIVIVDDGSTDKTVEIVKEYSSQDERIKFFQNQDNLGLVNNWNKCIELTNGEWIKFIFQDDYVSHDMIEKMMQYAQPEYKFIVCNREFVFEKDVSEEFQRLYTIDRLDLGKIFSLNHPAFISKKEICRKIVKWRYRNYIGEPTVILFQKSVVREVGLFNNKLAQICDLEYWFRLSSTYGLFYIPETLAWFRVHNESASTLNRKNKKELIDYIMILYELLFEKKFESFRKNINRYQKYLLLQVLKRQIHILKIYLVNNPDEKMKNSFKGLVEKIPKLKEIQDSSMSYYFLMPLIYLRRFIFKKFGITIG